MIMIKKIKMKIKKRINKMNKMNKIKNNKKIQIKYQKMK